MGNQEMVSEVAEILSNVLEMDKDNINISEDTKLVGGISEEDIGLSSIDYVEFLVGIEEHFNVAFDFDMRINTISELIDFIRAESGEK